MEMRSSFGMGARDGTPPRQRPGLHGTACSSLIPSSLLPVTAATISAFFFFLVFHICLRGDFSLFSFILMDSKITVESSQSRDLLPPHRVYPGGSQPMWIGVQVLSSPRNPRRWEMGRPRVSCCSHMEGEVSPRFELPLAMRVNINDLKCD